MNGSFTTEAVLLRSALRVSLVIQKVKHSQRWQLLRLMAFYGLCLCSLLSHMTERFSLDGREKDESLEWYEAVGYHASVAASTDVTGDRLETPKGFNDQLQEISKQRRTFFARYFEKLET